MPMLRHFWYRQYWHLFLCLLSMVQLLSSLQAYDKSFRTVLLKNPLHPSQLQRNEKLINNYETKKYNIAQAELYRVTSYFMKNFHRQFRN